MVQNILFLLRNKKIILFDRKKDNIPWGIIDIFRAIIAILFLSFLFSVIIEFLFKLFNIILRLVDYNFYECYNGLKPATKPGTKPEVIILCLHFLILCFTWLANTAQCLKSLFYNQSVSSFILSLT